MALPIITADQRLREKKGVKLVLLGKSGIGKTTQLKTLSEATTLFVDLEAGDLAVKDWRGDCVRPATWPEFRDLVVFLAGPNPALPPESPYSEAHYQHVCERYGDPTQLAKYDTYFVDSITVLARLALIWSKAQPQAMSERTGKPDTRGAYGLLIEYSVPDEALSRTLPGVDPNRRTPGVIGVIGCGDFASGVLVPALRAAGATRVIIAGKAAEYTDDSCAMGVDALAFLTRTREALS